MLLVVLLLLAFGFSHAAPVRVVASIHPLKLLVEDVGGEYVEVDELVPVGVSIHLWEMRPSDVKKVVGARLVVLAGCGAESGLRLPKGVRVWRLCEGPEGTNPHLWISLEEVARRLPSLAEALSRIDPSHSGYFRSRARTLALKLRRLRRLYMRRLAGAAVVSQHGAWVYLFRELNVDYLGALEPSPHREPGPRRLMMLIDSLRKRMCRVVVREWGHSFKLAETVAKRAGACVATMYPLGRGTERGFVDFIEENLKALEGCVRRCTR